MFQMSCGNKNKSVEKTDVLDIGSVFCLPDTIRCLDDSVCLGDYRNHLFKKKYKVVIYIDSVWCNSCRLNLYDWRNTIDDLQAINDDLSFILIIQPKRSQLKEIRILKLRDSFKHPIFLDYKGVTTVVNPFSVNNKCFLLDSEDMVLKSGDPNPRSFLWYEFEEVINISN